MQGPSRSVTAILCFALSIAFAASPLLIVDFKGFDPNLFPIPQQNAPVQPAGYAFAIWGIIYGWLILGSCWGLFKASTDGQWHDMRWPLCVSLALGSGWLWVATLSAIWATVLIWLMLLSALAALFLAPASNRAWAAYPVGLYAGWLAAASCVSLGLVAAGYGMLDQTMAALVCIGLAAVLGGSVQAALNRTPTFGIAVIWALIAIVQANWTTAPSVAYAAIIGAAVVLLPTLRAMRRG